MQGLAKMLWYVFKIEQIQMKMWKILLIDVMQIINKDNVQEGNMEANGYVISEGIIVIIRNAVIPDGSILWKFIILIIIYFEE